MPGTLILDSEGLSGLYREQRQVLGLITAAREADVRIATSVLTTLEADDKRLPTARVAWVLSRIDVADVDRELGAQARALLREHGRHGHLDAIDAVVSALARSAKPPVSVITSDPHDIATMCGAGVGIIALS